MNLVLKPEKFKEKFAGFRQPEERTVTSEGVS